MSIALLVKDGIVYIVPAVIFRSIYIAAVNPAASPVNIYNVCDKSVPMTDLFLQQSLRFITFIETDLFVHHCCKVKKQKNGFNALSFQHFQETQLNFGFVLSLNTLPEILITLCNTWKTQRFINRLTIHSKMDGYVRRTSEKHKTLTGIPEAPTAGHVTWTHIRVILQKGLSFIQLKTVVQSDARNTTLQSKIYLVIIICL